MKERSSQGDPTCGEAESQGLTESKQEEASDSGCSEEEAEEKLTCGEETGPSRHPSEAAAPLRKCQEGWREKLGAPRREAERRQAPAEPGEARGSTRVTMSLDSPRSGQGQWPWTWVKTLGASLRNFSPAAHPALLNAGPRGSPSLHHLQA